jgi:hypothetical protein
MSRCWSSMKETRIILKTRRLCRPHQGLGLFDRSVSVDQERTTADHIASTIELADYDSERKGLEALGLKVEVKEHIWVNWRSIHFHDPEGNQVELVCYDESLSASPTAACHAARAPASCCLRSK